jgi:hypothetical protein
VATRFDIERAVLASDLPPGCRHLCHVLCVRIDAQAGRILAAYQPSLTELARDTGRDRRTIMRYLTFLERRGWVTRARPKAELARRLHQRTQYAMRIPDYPQARDTMPPGLGTERREASDAMPPGLGTGSPEAGGTMPHRSSGSSGSSDADLEVIIKTIWGKAGITVTHEWAERVREQILGARDIRNSAAYLKRAIETAPKETYTPTATPPRDLCKRCGAANHEEKTCPN